MAEYLTPERLAEIRKHVASTTNWTLGNLAARDLLSEVARLRADLATAKDRLDHLERTTLPDLRREIEWHQAGKKRWRDRAKKAETSLADAAASGSTAGDEQASDLEFGIRHADTVVDRIGPRDVAEDMLPRFRSTWPDAVLVQRTVPLRRVDGGGPVTAADLARVDVPLVELQEQIADAADKARRKREQRAARLERKRMEHLRSHMPLDDPDRHDIDLVDRSFAALAPRTHTRIWKATP